MLIECNRKVYVLVEILGISTNDKSNLTCPTLIIFSESNLTSTRKRTYQNSMNSKKDFTKYTSSQSECSKCAVLNAVCVMAVDAQFLE